MSKVHLRRYPGRSQTLCGVWETEGRPSTLLYADTVTEATCILCQRYLLVEERRYREWEALTPEQQARRVKRILERRAQRPPNRIS